MMSVLYANTSDMGRFSSISRKNMLPEVRTVSDELETTTVTGEARSKEEPI